VHAGKLKGELLLDSREALRKGGESGPAVVPGKPDESLLVSALHYREYEMPPKGKLPDAVITAFEQWIRMGAPDPREGQAVATGRTIDVEKGREFWSFQPLLTSPVEIPDDMHGQPIDRLVQTKQQELGLSLSPTASPRILVRRAWFDLLGIPPQPQEIDVWTRRLRDSSSDGTTVNMQVWAELIDYLLTRPEYGERWARHWMDVARFAESSGYEHDSDRLHAFHYRDFLIKAFNSDLPYDQFVQWQIAGDQIEPDNPLAWMATGFLGAGAFPTQLTEAEFEKTRYDELDDMVSTTGVAFLGLSIGCARCHDHKFDPLTSEDYYRLVATFERTTRAEKSLDLEPAENERRQTEYYRQWESLQNDFDTYGRRALPAEFRQWLATADLQESSSTWRLLTGEITSSGQTSYTRREDGSYLAGETAADQEVVTFVAPVNGSFKSLRVEALSDASLPNKGPGRALNGNFALCRLQVSWIGSDGKPHALKIQSPRATFEQNKDSLSVASTLDDDPNSGWAVDGQIGRDHAAVFDLDSPPEMAAESSIQIKLIFSHPNPRHAIGRIRFSLTDAPNAVAETGDVGTPENIRRALAHLQSMTPERLKAAERENSNDWQLAIEWFKSQSPMYQALANKLSELETAGTGVRMTKVLVASDGLPHLPHNADDRGYPHFYTKTYLLRRGDVTQKVSLVTPGFPEVLQKSSRPGSSIVDVVSNDDRGSNRARQRLAIWLTDLDSGAGALVARVAANRIWQHHFGKGIVATPNDFGTMGERPSNLELLDWMAQELVSNGWRLKPLHKVIMTSQTYLQGNQRIADERSGIDPDNVHVWHRPPRRLEAEAIRDSMLVVAGQLDRTMHGPGSLDANMKRRSIYFFVKRSQLIPSLMLFDWPEHLVSIGQRQTTTVAPQALLFMNSEQCRSYAEAFAQRIVAEDADATVEQAYSIAYGRRPTAAETKVSREFLTRATQLRTADRDPNARLLATADFCQMLMSTNEFIYID
jgi:hypothetical protein